MCGIFGYYNFKVSRDRRAILELLFTGLRRLEYRGYDSAGISIDADELAELVSAVAALDAHPTPLRPVPMRQASYDGSLPLSPVRSDDSAAAAGPFANGKPAASAQRRSSPTGLPPPAPSANGNNAGSPGDRPVANGVAGGHLANGNEAAAALSRRSSVPRTARRPLVIKSQGKVEALVDAAYAELETGCVDLDREFLSHVGIAHTRWATHGAPSARNSHPQSSDARHEWLVVHNGIITNWKPLKDFLVRIGSPETMMLLSEGARLLSLPPTWSPRPVLRMHLQMLSASSAAAHASCAQSVSALEGVLRRAAGEAGRDIPVGHGHGSHPEAVQVDLPPLAQPNALQRGV